MVDRAMDQDPMAIERVPDALQFTVANVSAFESVIERCLDLPVSNLATMPGKINEDGTPKEEEMKSDSDTWCSEHPVHDEIELSMRFA